MPIFIQFFFLCYHTCNFNWTDRCTLPNQDQERCPTCKSITNPLMTPGYFIQVILFIADILQDSEVLYGLCRASYHISQGSHLQNKMKLKGAILKWCFISVKTPTAICTVCRSFVLKSKSLFTLSCSDHSVHKSIPLRVNH